MAKKPLAGIFLFVVLTGAFVAWEGYFWKASLRNPQSFKILEKPLDKYTYENLRNRRYTGSRIIVSDTVKDAKDFETRSFSFNAEGKKVTGQANFPKDGKKLHPIIIMFRGYVSRETYRPGDGTRHAGEYFAGRGFVTLAPDFAGYGGSDPADTDTLKARFETYITAATLMNSVNDLPQVDTDHIFVWGHSNGGQIAITALEITGANYPTVLWAPVSKPFPYSILFYSDEASDSGKALRMVVAGFDRNYDAQKYSLNNYLDWIVSPIMLQQGVGDDTVLPRWSRELNKNLKELNKEVKYFEYTGDHNFSGSWNKVIADDLEFFNSFLK